MAQSHDWECLPNMWYCPTCRACLIPEQAERFGMSWPPTDAEESRLIDIEYKGPCWPKSPMDERQLEYWKSSVAGQSLTARREVAKCQRDAGQWAPDPVP